MSGFPGSPRLIKGAIIGLDPLNPLASVVVFQYNPETMTRLARGAPHGRRRHRRPLGSIPPDRSAQGNHHPERGSRRHRRTGNGQSIVGGG
ncbi:hypothetical protein LP419_31015 [Massilia sp. H-1]|nr:hypothetical protein LP419_31015 [Massilia sp. H-1]